jgi:HEAT repeat protein
VLRRLEKLLGLAELRTIAAVWAFGRMRSRAATDGIVDRIAVLLGAFHANVYLTAREAIQRMGRSALQRAIQTILRLLGSSERREVDIALRALSILDSHAAQEAILEQVVMMLGHESADRRLAGIWAVGAIGDQAFTETIRQRLVELCDDPDDRVLYAARAALG